MTATSISPTCRTVENRYSAEMSHNDQVFGFTKKCSYCCSFCDDEVKEIIRLPSKPCQYAIDPNLVVLSPKVLRQSQDFVENICIHSSMQVVTTNRSINYKDLTYNTLDKQHIPFLHKYTYGITSDPLTQFAVAFSALIHDVDHQGVPNAQLCKEETPDAIHYQFKSVAQQNSVDVAWGLLMEPVYTDLRGYIFSTQDELDRFRELVVKKVMATDIVDKELGALRRDRWEKAFAVGGISSALTSKSVLADGEVNVRPSGEAFLEEGSDRKATIVIEHLIQASDMAHTMQHWHVYLKWNERFFDECYETFKDGRSEHNPVINWYEGELGFYDHYIIPLAKKLKECGVFGVSSDEYLNYAEANRQEWEKNGRDLVQTYLRKYES